LRLTCIRRSKGAVTVVVGAALGESFLAASKIRFDRSFSSSGLNVIRFWEMEWHADHGGIVSSGLRSVLHVRITAGGLVDPLELVWLVDLSNLLMNINALVTPIICFIFTRGFKDLFFVIRFAPPKGSFDEKDFNRQFTPMLSSEYHNF
ncbi:hypothetical protein ANCCEY_07412, partial [Ancylostoma ceylanicum]